MKPTPPDQANPTLGIAIPTYKRPEQLLPCVRSVIRAAEPHRVPVYLLDDATDDTNTAAIAELREAYPLVHHIRNEKNLGIARNILKSADTCPCEYVWLLGEDDRMHPHGVESVLAAIRERPNPFVFANYSAVDNDMRFLIKERSLPADFPGELDGETFFRSVAWSMGFIGACVIRKAEWDRVDPAPYLDSYFAHVGKIMEMIHGKRVTLITDPLILNRCGSPEIFTWTGDAANVLGGWARMTRALEPVYGPEAGKDSLAAFRRAHGIGTLKFYAYLRADGVFTPSLCKEMVTPENSSASARCAAWLIARTPPALFRAARALLMWGRKLRSPDLDPLTTG
ncbi:MAG: glycosyltransferase [Kiritimatiellae bacterium]|nr:glycosyltransferase [Kiritimatiellia bacterium]